MEGRKVITPSPPMAVASGAAWTLLPLGLGQGHREHSVLQARHDLLRRYRKRRTHWASKDAVGALNEVEVVLLVLALEPLLTGTGSIKTKWMRAFLRRLFSLA
jgi:hypothetical protein